jgi:1-acyl-sn-glycerol-3-phosphate acyltransferase
VLLVANHPNGLIDPAVVVQSVGRRVRMLAKAPLFDMPVIGPLIRALGGLPVYRAKDGADTAQNARTFEAVEEALLAGEAVLIFPEGVSHDEPRLLPLKTGASRMALGALARGAHDVKVIPLGLIYRDKSRFRSEVAVQVGTPIDVSAHAPASDGDDDERHAVRALTDAIADQLGHVTVNLEQWEDLPLLEAVDAIWQRDADEPHRLARLQSLSDGVSLLRKHAPIELEHARQSLLAWSEHLDELSLTPRDFERSGLVDAPVVRLSAFAIRNACAVVLGTPIALLGALAFLPAWGLTLLLAKLLKPDADVLATVKLLAGILFVPAWWLVSSVGVAFTWGVPTALSYAFVVPLCGLYAHHYLRQRGRAIKDALAFVRLVGRSQLQAQLDVEKTALVAEFDALARRVDVLREAAAHDVTGGAVHNPA